MYINNQTRNLNQSLQRILAEALALAAILSLGACATTYNPQGRGTFNAGQAAQAYLMFQQMQRNETYYVPGAQPIQRQPSSQDCVRNPNGVCWR